MNINATFFAELLAFCIFVFITYRYIWPSMENLLEDRRKEISDGLEAASQSQRKLEEANTESSKILDEAKAEASNLINQAGSRGDQILDEAKNQAVEEQKKIKASAEADIEQNINKAKEGLRQEVSALVIAGAEQILNKEVDEKANKEIVEKLIKEL
ncbi:MAG: F0F1 ATP synthase subunit B [Gammaproteobacteria bacterium]|jgi:F-type H+-transporting ATPase subunit b|nr:MAG: F0F1 ATP synthase subunit B [Gammaproteobacteria bacterium TMED159]RCL40190.1 MAG: F0F1 ATP synthase subunit B [Gammaproteobacteria bacterium]